MNSIRYVIVFVVGFAAIACSQKNETTKLNHVNDYAYILTGEETDSLTQEIKELENSIGSQIVIITIANLNGQDIDDYSLQTANKWGIGRKDFDDGILITVVTEEKKMRIEVGVGLEKIITNEIATKINTDDMAPKFREEKYYEGLNLAVTKIKHLITENKDIIGQK